ncbi:LytR family transcriptional regulator [candidate division WS5 bacterium]|uniref:LytR family transcriptional regulator n=1 Tax=candidate division WS5 bacterium TaxID=2093353 RepID=A0A419DCF8_9BACT|nr:MAG: LytR family transcriptional regulator [candidate division WS5 bacterium]
MKEYYLEVLKKGEKPDWPHPAQDLVEGNQPLESGYIQYWAYPKESNQDADDLPPAEVLAAEYPGVKSAILIDQPKEDELELILVHKGHAWARTPSNLANLEANLTALIEFAEQNFTIKAEHFMTTERVAAKVEHKLDELAEADENFTPVNTQEEDSLAGSKEEDEDGWQIKPLGAKREEYEKMEERVVLKSSVDRTSKGWVFLPVVILLIVFTFILIKKDWVMSRILKTSVNSSAEKVIVSPTPSPTPEPIFDRSEYKIRVLNGTRKTGAAGVLGKQLTDLGWVVDKVGNAKNQSTPQTLVSVKEGYGRLLQQLLDDLKEDYEATSGPVLSTEDTIDGEVVIGNK